MRQRRLKDLDERMERLSRWFLDEPERFRGEWDGYFASGGRKKNSPLFLEIGCGKGRFIVEHAVKEPDHNFVALEGQESVIVRAMDKAEAAELDNLAFLSVYMKDIRDYFGENEIDGLYLNFSDPWPKARHAARRLTHRNYLEKYMEIIRPGGFIEFKTDNDDLFEFSVEELEAMKEKGLKVVAVTRDLHSSEYAEGNIMTEYEEKFSGRGKNINYVRAELI